MPKRQRLGIFPLLIALALLVERSAAHADTPFEMGSNIRIEAAIASPTPRGGTTRIRFRIINDSGAAFHLIGIDTPVAPEAKLVARIGKTATTVLD